MSEAKDAKQVVTFNSDDLIIMKVNDGKTLLGQLSGFGIEISVNTEVVKNVQQVKAVAKTLADAFEATMLNDLISKAGEADELKKNLQVPSQEKAKEEVPVMHAEVVQDGDAAPASEQ